VDVTDVTRLDWKDRRSRLRRWLGGVGAPPSLRAQITLMVSAFALGGVVAALLFVGIWRHTAAESDRARTAQLIDRHRMQVAERRLETVEAQLTAEHAALVRARRSAARAGGRLRALKRLHAAVARSLPGQVAAVETTASALAHDGAKLTSELAALRHYLREAEATGIDPGFVNAQINYLIGSSDSVRSAVAKLEQQAESARASAAKLSRKN
jgi:hypothetical protein